MTKAVWGARIRLAGVLILIVLTTSCGDMVRQGTASSYLVITSLEAASGADPEKFGNTLYSDVETIIDIDGVKVATIYPDPGRVTFRLALKDPGSSSSPSSPSQVNAITLERYHVRFFRADGRNTEGVDVPHAFDGAITFTVGAEASGTFEIVRHIAKKEAPLMTLRASGTIILALAEITFYGHDQTGRAVSAVGTISIEFGNFADPK